MQMEEMTEMILLIGGAYQGKYAYAQEHYAKDHVIYDRYHETVRQQLQKGDDPLEKAKRLLAKDEKQVIISDEVGYGLVPVDSFEREYRETVGRVNCVFAKEAEQVIRIVCGMPVQIK